MRAVVYDRYGPPDVLRLEDVERPVPKEDEVLVRVHATTVNRTDTGFRSAEYFITRFFTGLRRPKRRILGSELAGEVEAVGAAVSEFEVGDRVFGVRAGAHAEFICIRESAPLAHMPTDMTFEEAAAVCDGAILALAYLRRADLRKGGMYAVTDLGFLWQNPFLALWTSRIGDKKVLFPIPRYTKTDVVFLKELIEAGKYRAVIDRCYPLEDVVDATRYVETEQKTGNVVLTVNGGRAR